jgi:Kelch motif/Galactose oxidase, central domain
MEGLEMGGCIQRATVGIVALAVAMALAGAGAAQAAWAGADTLATGRYDHTATLLNDGRVLVAGGNDDGPLASAQLYDPATSKWSSAASMHFERHGHAAASLPSGKLLVAGGYAPSAEPVSPATGYTRTAEIYDPATDTWMEAANMSTGRFQPTMTVLQDGRVLVAGGSGDIETADGVRAAVPLASAEIYDPQTDRWTDVPPMSVPRSLHTATRLPDGEVLVAGGYDDASGELSSAELYDPAGGRRPARWRRPVTPPLPPRCRTATSSWRAATEATEPRWRAPRSTGPARAPGTRPRAWRAPARRRPPRC